MAVGDDPVGGELLSRPDDEQVADNERLDRDALFTCRRLRR